MTTTKTNIILAVDSYKASHWRLMPPNTERMFYYIEARKTDFPTKNIVVFGLQAWIKSYLLTPITQEDIEEAAEFFAAHGEPFNRDGWEYVLRRHGGYLPISIRAVDEGTVLPIGNVIATVENHDPLLFWLPGWIETALLRAIWYPTTVATLSWHAKRTIREYLDKTSEAPDAVINFMLHDFGARGVSSGESALLGGMAHLVNFMGSDTVEGIIGARRFYDEPMAAFSIPASEHSTITSWGRAREVDAYRNLIQKFGGKDKIVACVSDSYDLWNAIENIWGKELREDVLNMGGRLVVRPDSGDPATVVLKAVEKLGEAFGYTVNAKGYKVLNPAVRVIQGDGINLKSIERILNVLFRNGWSAENVAFGMGGGLLQQVNRDTLGFAMKASAVMIDGVWHAFNKSPVDDPGKASKAGRLALVESGQGFQTVPLEGREWENLLVERYRTEAGIGHVKGVMVNRTTFSDVGDVQPQHDDTEALVEASASPNLCLNAAIDPQSRPREWVVDGRFHRLDGPAVIQTDGTLEWWVEGLRHRIGGPARISVLGTEEWFVDGKLHRVDGPARIFPSGSQEWWVDDKRHRLDGPALIYADGAEEWYANNKSIDFHILSLMKQGSLGADWTEWTDEDRIVMRLCFGDV